MHINDLIMRCLSLGYNVPGKAFRVVTLVGSVTTVSGNVGLVSGTVVGLASGAEVGLVSGTVVGISGNVLLDPASVVGLSPGTEVGVVPGNTTARILVDNALNGGIEATSVIVGVSPTLMPANALTNRRHIALYNLAGVTVYLGGSAVTIANGLPLPAGEPYSADMSDDTLLYSIAGISNCEVRVMEVA